MGGVIFSLPIPQAKEAAEHDIWSKLQENSNYEFIDINKSLQLTVILAQNAHPAEKIQQAQEFYLNTNMLVLDEKSCFPNQTLVNIASSNLPNATNLFASKTSDTLGHVAKANRHLTTIFDFV